MYISEHDKGVIRQVIEKQLQAFQQDDAISAFACASPPIQKQFGTPEKFLSMIKTAYQAVYRPRSVMFRGFTTIDDYPAQVVLLMDTAGAVIKAVYIMQQQLDYSWRIHGCFLVPLDKQTS